MTTKTAISILQEYADAHKLAVPKYVEMGRNSDNTLFVCCCNFNGNYQEIGFGTTKKLAKHDSAQKTLDILLKHQQIDNKSQLIATTIKHVDDKLTNQENYVGKLNEFALKYQLAYPKYNFIDGLGVFNGIFSTECILNKYQTIGHGRNKKDSKQDAAKCMLEILKRNCNEFEQITANKQQNWPVDDCDYAEITKLYKHLSLNKQTSIKTECGNVEAAPDIQMSDSIESLKSELKKYNVSYKLQDFQLRPWIVVFQADNTNFTLIGHGETKNDAIKDVLKSAINVKKTGVSISTTTLR